jgi:hypothetical protein
MTGEASRYGKERFAYWSGYTPARRAADGTTVPLDSDELRSESARFRRGADRAAGDGDAAMVEKLRIAADDFDRRADASGWQSKLRRGSANVPRQLLGGVWVRFCRNGVQPERPGVQPRLQRRQVGPTAIGAKGVPKAAHRKSPQTWAEMSTLSNAVQRPIPTPAGTEMTKSARVKRRLISEMLAATALQRHIPLAVWGDRRSEPEENRFAQVRDRQ